MEFPTLNEVTRYREMTSAFGGYNHQLSCKDGQFYDMQNMTSQYYPILSPREKRGFVKQMTAPQGILDKEDLLWVDDGKLYRNGEEVLLEGVTLNSEEKVMAKMGAYVIILPDKVWWNENSGECGYMEVHKAIVNLTGSVNVKFSLCDSNGSAIVWHDEEYYKTNEPKNGDYMMSTVNGKTVLKVYSASTALWGAVATTYIKMETPGANIGSGFEVGDGVKITIDNSEAQWNYASNIFVNDEGNGKLSTNTYIADKGTDYITFVGLLDKNTDLKTTVWVDRNVPDMAFITECNNRLWGCSEDGHEIYCCKLGDVKNWNCFMGISTDSWAVTIGSDGKFTGAITYLGYPMFFKEDCFIKIAISSTGGHQTKETRCRGVQRGSGKSLAILNETLYYKSTTGICSYAGSLPSGISDSLGEVRYESAVGGTINNKYYVSMKDKSGKSHLFVYDQKTGIWSKEDNTEVLFFCRHEDELYFIDAKDKYMKSVRGTLPYEVSDKYTEDKFPWFVESGNIGYSMVDNKYVSRINVRVSLDFGTNADFYIQYDSSGIWEHKFNMSGKGTRSFTVPVIPKRCDHFKYKLVGKGGCKIYSITKTIEQGSDI